MRVDGFLGNEGQKALVRRGAGVMRGLGVNDCVEYCVDVTFPIREGILPCWEGLV